MKNATLSGSMPGRNVIGRFVENNRKTIVEVIAALFILLFLYTALSKSFEIGRTVNVLKKTPFFLNFAEIIAWFVVITEYLISALLFIPKTRKIGLYASLILMIGFTTYIAYMMIFVPALPCTCGGVISKMTWKQHLAFNLIFILLALLGIRLSRKDRKQELDSNYTDIVFT